MKGANNMTFNKKAGVGILGAFVLALPFMFQNCGQAFEGLPSLGGSTDMNSVYGQSLSEVDDSNCLQNPNVDACVYYKSPIVMLGATIDYANLRPSLEALQTRAVKLAMPIEQLRETNTLTVMNSNGVSLSTDPQSRLKFSFSAQDPSMSAQVMTHFWFQKTLQVLAKSGYANSLHGKDLKVIVDAPATGWASNKNMIALGRTSRNDQVSLDGSVFVHLLGEALIHHETAGQVAAIDPAKHRTCYSERDRLVTYECCTSANGCTKAITVGMSDFLNSIVFPERPAVGEFTSRSPAGANRCGVARDPIANLDRTFATAYAACADFPAEGHIYTLGAVLASSFYSVHVNLPAEQSAGFVRLYFDSLKQIRGNDDFLTFFEKVLAIDEAKYQGLYSPLLRAELVRRGLTL
jgi:hypothetical protein